MLALPRQFKQGIVAHITVLELVDVLDDQLLVVIHAFTRVRRQETV